MNVCRDKAQGPRTCFFRQNPVTPGGAGRLMLTAGHHRDLPTPSSPELIGDVRKRRVK